MKKIAAVISALLVLSMGTAVFAADSPTAGKDIVDTKTNSASETSPKTGAEDAVLPAVALLCAAGVVICGSKVVKFR